MRIPLPPSTLTGELYNYLLTVAGRLNNEMPISIFSGTSPESIWTGVAGNLAVNVGSASTNTRLWVKGGDPRIPSTTSWHPVRIA